MALFDRLAYELSLRTPTNEAARSAMNGLIVRFIRLLAAEKRAGGSRLLTLGKKVAVRAARYRAARLERLFDLNPRDMADMSRLQDWEDSGFGVEGEWRERGKTRATKCETACPFAEAATEVPEFCTDIVHAFETETYRTMNPTYRLVPLTRLLSKGDSHCEFAHEISG